LEIINLYVKNCIVCSITLLLGGRVSQSLIAVSQQTGQSDKEKCDACHADDRTGNLNSSDFFLVDPC
jgi:hypothetical protein